MPAISTIKLRAGTAAAWTTANPVLALGEPGLERDTGKVKFGDGSTAWNSLAYAVKAAGTTAGTLAAGDDVRILGATASPFEKMPFTAYGHSYVATAGGAGTTSGGRWVERLATLLRTATLTNYGVGGTTLNEIASRALATWMPGTRGLVALMGVVNSVQYLEGAPTTRESLRVFLATVSAAAKYEESALIFGFNGTWSAGPSTGVSGGVSQRTTTIGDSVDVYLATGSGYLITQMSSASGGTITATRAGTGATIAVWSTNGFNPHTSPGPMVLPVLGEAAGTTVRFTLTSGAGFTVDGLLVPNAVNPPVVLWMEEGPSTAYGVVNGNTVQENNAALVDYLTTCEAVAALWPNCFTKRMTDAGWDPAVMAWSVDGLHPNDYGQMVITAAAEARLMQAVPTYRDGLNLITATPTIVVAPSGYYVGSPTVPAAPTSLTAIGPIDGNVSLSALVRSTGGSVITGYKWQYRTTAGPGSWTALPDTVGSTTVATGLVDGTSYDFRAAAVNAVGAGAYGSPVTPAAIYLYDFFTRADAASLGTAPGGTAWTSQTGNGIASNTAGGSALTVANPSFIETGHANAVTQATVTTAGSVGIVARLTDVNNHIILAGGAGQAWKVYKRVAGVFTVIIDSGTQLAVNDIAQLICSGDTISAKVNGVPIGPDATETFNNTATKSGIRLSDAAGRLDNFFVTA